MDFIDDYAHPVSGVYYFPQSIPTKEAQELYPCSTSSCQCNEICSSESDCLCLKMSETFYIYDDILNRETYRIQENNSKKLSYECNSRCKCNSKICGNRLIQYGPRTSLIVKSANNKGLGLFTIKPIESGNFICEYTGEILVEKEAMDRYKINNERNLMNYIFCVKETFGSRVLQTFIDPTYYGNIGRYINHSCEPNCNLFVVRIENTIPVLGIFANRNIDVGEEITYSYGDNHTSNDMNITKTCQCGSVSCNKVLPFDVTLKWDSGIDR